MHMKTDEPIPSSLIKDNSEQNLPTDAFKNLISPDQDGEFLRMLCEALDVGVSILDKDLIYRFISRSTHDLLNMDETDLKVGDSMSHCHDMMLANGMLTPEIIEENNLSAARQQTRETGGGNEFPRIVKLCDGSIREHIRKTLPNGYTVSMSHDITELVEKDTMLEQALALGNSGYWDLNVDTQKYLLSDSLDHYFTDFDKNLIKQEGILALVHPDDRPKFWKGFAKLSEHNKTFSTAVRITPKNGKERWNQVNIELLQDKEGNWNRVRAFIRDVTKMKQQSVALAKAKDEAVAASVAKSQFLANMSHEIRTPLNGVMGMAELLSRTNIDGRQRDFIDIITQSATQLLMIINDVLDFSRVEAGEMKIDSAPMNLRQTVEDVSALVAPLARDRGVELIVNYPESTPRNFNADNLRIRQIITNLVGNATKFTDEGYISINVKVKEATDTVGIVTIEVTDTGIGIPEEKLGNIFGKFTQVDSSTTRVHGGTGLGLSITKSLTEIMNGRIKVRSTLGEGSTFSVHLPLEYNLNAAPQRTHSLSLVGTRALIVDDIDVNRRILSEMLAEWGMETVTAADAMMALSILKRTEGTDDQFDVIITDHLMPELNGQDFARRIKNNDTLTKIPMIMLSSCDREISVNALKDIGIEHYLTKPARSERLYNALSETLSQVTERKKNRPILNDTLMEKIHAKVPKTKIGFCEILVAEDIPLNQEVVRYMLDGSPYNPTIVDNGKRAVEAYRTDPAQFSAILMDISMPIMDGLEATKYIRDFQTENGLPHIPIIALTGHALKGDREKALQGGLDDYITKPVNHEDLLTILEKWANYSCKPQEEVA